MGELGIQHIVSTAYHPESQGAIERFHQTLKSMVKKYSLSKSSRWEKDLPFLLFAVRSVPNDSLGFSPFEMVFGHNVRGPLEVVRDNWEKDTEDDNVLDWMSRSRGRLYSAWEFAKQNLVKSQRKMKEVFGFKSKQRSFNEGGKVLVLLSIPGN